MTHAVVAIVASAVALLAAANPAAGKSDASARNPGPCSSTMSGGATVHVYCGPAKATVTFGGKTVTFKGGNCGVAKSSLAQGWGLGIGKYTVPPAKPKFKYFAGVAYIGSPKAGTYKKGGVHRDVLPPGQDVHRHRKPARDTLDDGDGHERSQEGLLLRRALGIEEGQRAVDVAEPQLGDPRRGCGRGDARGGRCGRGRGECPREWRKDRLLLEPLGRLRDPRDERRRDRHRPAHEGVGDELGPDVVA